MRGERVADAVQKAGGPTSIAQVDAINLAQELQDGQQVRIPAEGEELPVQEFAPQTMDKAAGSKSEKGTLININTASAEELQKLPRVGPVLSANIVAYREENGPYAAVEDLDQVPGIGLSMLANLTPLVRVSRKFLNCRIIGRSFRLHIVGGQKLVREATTFLDVSYTPGSTVQLRGRITKENTRLTLTTYNANIISSTNPRKVDSLKQSLREKSVQRIGENPTALLLGMSYGDDSTMDETTRKKFSDFRTYTPYCCIRIKYYSYFSLLLSNFSNFNISETLKYYAMR